MNTPPTTPLASTGTMPPMMALNTTNRVALPVGFTTPPRTMAPLAPPQGVIRENVVSRPANARTN